MPKYPLGKVPLKVTSCWGSSLKIQLAVATDHQILIFFFLWHRIHSYSQKKKFHKTTYKCSYSNQHHFQYVVYTASFFFSFKYTSTYRTMTICEYTFDD